MKLCFQINSRQNTHFEHFIKIKKKITEVRYIPYHHTIVFSSGRLFQCIHWSIAFISMSEFQFDLNVHTVSIFTAGKAIGSSSSQEQPAESCGDQL